MKVLLVAVTSFAVSPKWDTNCFPALENNEKRKEKKRKEQKGIRRKKKQKTQKNKKKNKKKKKKKKKKKTNLVGHHRQFRGIFFDCPNNFINEKVGKSIRSTITLINGLGEVGQLIGEGGGG